MISAIILAAGQSTRMGQPKMILPWGNTTVLGKVIETLEHAGVEDMLVVTGSARVEVETIATSYGLQVVQNERKGEMLESIQIGLETLRRSATTRTAALIALGDQPQIEAETARKIIAAWNQTRAGIIVPSYEKRRGHPWLIAETYWEEIIRLPAEQSMRDFFNQHRAEIFYVNVETPTILQDLDTPADYLKYKP